MKNRIKFRALGAGAVKLEGHIGRKMDLCMKNRVCAQGCEPLVEPFKNATDSPSGFRGEFWGKWFTSLVLAYYYQPTEETRAQMKDAVYSLMAAQSSDGCISSYLEADQHGMWDVWSRKYVLLGLIAYYEETLDENALNAAERMLEHFCSQVGPGKINLADCGHQAWAGLPPSSILEPVAMLYRITGRKLFLDLAEWIVGCWSRQSCFLPCGLRLVEQSLAGVAAKDVGNPKAYEQMSCFEGLCEMYTVTAEQKYLDAAVALAMDIRQTERSIVGSGCNHEMWCDTVRYQTEILEQPLETCATVTWMKLCFRLLQITGNPLWADEMELTLYNALLASMTPDGKWWSYYSPLQGERVPSHYQYDEIGLSCCVANGPRALLLSPKWAVMQDETGVAINLYESGSAAVRSADGVDAILHLQTGYPKDNEVKITIDCETPIKMDLRLRIPAWSRISEVVLHGRSYLANSGEYYSIHRVWENGDEVVLKLELAIRTVAAPCGAPSVALQRGPLVLALDNRIAQPNRLSLRLPVGEEITGAETIEHAGEDFFYVCRVPCVYHKVHIETEAHTLTFCDYASAGNGWSADNLFRVWLPQPLFMENAYVKDTWKLMYPEMELRPEMPKR